MLYFLLGLLFLAAGSVLNVVIYRLPVMLQQEWLDHYTLQDAQTELPEAQSSINLFFPRSFCPHCKHMIAWWWNIPFFSFMLLRGRCRYCHQPISWQYPLVELLFTLLAFVALYFWGLTLTFIAAIGFMWIAIAIIWIDAHHQIIPDSLSLGLLWLGLLMNTQTVFTTLPLAVSSAAGAYLLLRLFIDLYYLCTGKIGMGQGDFKLFAALGAWFGAYQSPFILIIAALGGIVVGGLHLFLTKKSKNTPIPFGPFLCIAGGMALFHLTPT